MQIHRFSIWQRARNLSQFQPPRASYRENWLREESILNARRPLFIKVPRADA
jgi:hypothetical protein